MPGVRNALVVAAALMLSACGGGTPTAPALTQANLTVTFQPTPVTSTVCNPECVGSTGAFFQFLVPALTIVVQESAGIGSTITSLTVGSIIRTADQIITDAGTNRVSAKGSLGIPLPFVYNTPDGTSAASFNVIVQVTDDKGNQILVTAILSVN